MTRKCLDKRPENAETPPANTSSPQPTNTGNPQPANTGYPQPANTGYPQPTNTGYPQPANTGYPQPANTGNPQPANTGYPQPANTGYPQPVNTGYPQPANTGYPQPANTGYPQPANTGYPQPANVATYPANPDGRLPISISQLGPEPNIVICRSCNQQILTRVLVRPSMKTHLVAIIICLLFWPCVFLPYCIPYCQNTEHYCPNCNAYIGVYSTM